jgi:hypothetical protein
LTIGVLRAFWTDADVLIVLWWYALHLWQVSMVLSRFVVGCKSNRRCQSVLLTIFQCFRDKDILLEPRLTSMATRAYNHCSIVQVRFGRGLAISPRDLHVCSRRARGAARPGDSSRDVCRLDIASVSLLSGCLLASSQLLGFDCSGLRRPSRAARYEDDSL